MESKLSQNEHIYKITTVRNISFFSVLACSYGEKVASKMSTTTTTTEPVQPAPAATKAKKKGAIRKPGRPYRRLSDEVLGSRKETLDKKLQVLVARRTLLEDRLKARGRGGGAPRGRVCGVTGHGAARAAARVFV